MCRRNIGFWNDETHQNWQQTWDDDDEMVQLEIKLFVEMKMFQSSFLIWIIIKFGEIQWPRLMERMSETKSGNLSTYWVVDDEDDECAPKSNVRRNEINMQIIYERFNLLEMSVYARPSERGGRQTNKWFLQFMIDIEIIDTNKARVLDAQRFSQAG